MKLYRTYGYNTGELWTAIDLENDQIQKARNKGRRYSPEVLNNGDTAKQLLARSRFLLL